MARRRASSTMTSFILTWVCLPVGMVSTMFAWLPSVHWGSMLLTLCSTTEMEKQSLTGLLRHFQCTSRVFLSSLKRHSLELRAPSLEHSNLWSKYIKYSEWIWCSFHQRTPLKCRKKYLTEGWCPYPGVPVLLAANFNIIYLISCSRLGMQGFWVCFWQWLWPKRMLTGEFLNCQELSRWLIFKFVSVWFK